jgi:hypothetical protein
MAQTVDLYPMSENGRLIHAPCPLGLEAGAPSAPAAAGSWLAAVAGPWLALVLLVLALVLLAGRDDRR